LRHVGVLDRGRTIMAEINLKGVIYGHFHAPIYFSALTKIVWNILDHFLSHCIN
jgi:hypothetical protein